MKGKTREIFNTLCLFYGGDLKEDESKVIFTTGAGRVFEYQSLEEALYDWLETLCDEVEGTWDSEIEFIESLADKLTVSEKVPNMINNAQHNIYGGTENE